MLFKNSELSKHLTDALKVANYSEMYPIQEQTIPAILKKSDVLGLAPTGSGKTLAYVLPILELLNQKESSKNRSVSALVLVPTRELAVQVQEVFKLMSVFLPKSLKTMAVYGGVSINPQMMGLYGTEILIATPGRLLDLIAKNAVEFNNLQILVLDEADKILNLGFKEEVDQIFKLLPKKRQNLLFSATMDQEVEALINKTLNNPIKVEVQTETITPDLIAQCAYLISAKKKGPLLRYLIKNGNWNQVLVFTSSIRTADNLVVKLNKNGVEALAFHGDKSQGSRTESLKMFKAGKLKVLVATDLASRGIDIQLLPFVVNYELPRSPKDYIHRIGRTGRAENLGQAISLISPEDEHHFKIIQKKIGKSIDAIDANEYNFQGI